MSSKIGEIEITQGYQTDPSEYAMLRGSGKMVTEKHLKGTGPLQNFEFGN